MSACLSRLIEAGESLLKEHRAQLFEGRLALNPGFIFLC